MENRPQSALSLADARRLASLGEGLHIEFKRRVPAGPRIAKEISALANTRGGRLMIGVTDAGEVVGLRDVGGEEFALNQALEVHCDPPVTLTTERIPVSRRRDLIVVTIPVSGAKPHYVVDDGKRQAYVRIADMSVEASREAVRLMKLGDVETDVKFEFGDKELMLMRYLDEYGRISVAQFARLAAVPTRSASRTLVLLTRARILALHMDPGGDYFTLIRSAVA